MKQPKSSLHWSFDLGDGVRPATVCLLGIRQPERGEANIYSEQYAIVSRGDTAASAFAAAARRLRRLASEADRRAVALHAVPRGGFDE